MLQVSTTVMIFSKNAAKIEEQLKRSPGYNATGGSGKTSLEINHVCIWCTLLGTVSGVCGKREQEHKTGLRNHPPPPPPEPIIIQPNSSESRQRSPRAGAGRTPASLTCGRARHRASWPSNAQARDQSCLPVGMRFPISPLVRNTCLLRRSGMRAVRSGSGGDRESRKARIKATDWSNLRGTFRIVCLSLLWHLASVFSLSLSLSSLSVQQMNSKVIIRLLDKDTTTFALCLKNRL